MTTGRQSDTVLSAPVTERIIALLVDLVVVMGLFFFPRIGWMFSTFYFLVKDSLPFLKGQSFGKHLMKIKVITIPDQNSLIAYPEKSVIRALVMLIPGLNLLDLWYFFKRGHRLADIWAQTTVVYVDDLGPEDSE